MKTEYITNTTSNVAYKIDKVNILENSCLKMSIISFFNFVKRRKITIKDKSIVGRKTKYKPLIPELQNKTTEKSNLSSEEKNESNIKKVLLKNNILNLILLKRIKTPDYLFINHPST